MPPRLVEDLLVILPLKQEEVNYSYSRNVAISGTPEIRTNMLHAMISVPGAVYHKMRRSPDNQFLLMMPACIPVEIIDEHDLFYGRGGIALEEKDAKRLGAVKHMAVGCFP